MVVIVVVASHSVVPNSLQPHGLQHATLPCPSLSPRVCSNSCPLCWWYQPIISSSASCFSYCPQSFSTSESFPMSQLFTSGGQIIGASASISVLPVNIQGWFPLGLTGLISLISKGLSRVFSSTSLKASMFQCSALFFVLLSHLYMTTLKTIALTRQIFVNRWCLCFLTCCLGLLAFLPRSKHLNFMVAITIHSACEVQESGLSLFPFFPQIFAMTQMPSS